MRVGTGALLCIGTLGLFGSCKSQDIYNKTLKKQYELIDKERSIINKNSGSLLEPNGRLSSIMGDDIVYFLTKEDSIAFDNQVKLAYGMIPDVRAQKENELKTITNNYNNSVISSNGYYNSQQKKAPKLSEKFDIEIKHNGEIERLKEQNTYLTKAINQEYDKEMKQAKRMKSSILHNAYKMKGVSVIKGGARRLVRSALR